MLSFFRQRGFANVLYGAIIIATILTFVIEFRPSAATRTASLNETCVARIRSRCIDPKTFTAAYRMLLPTRSAKESRKLNLKRVALDGLIERELLDDEAKRLGISVTDDEVTDQLFAGIVRVSVPAANPTVAQTILSETYQAYVRAGLMSQDVALAHMGAGDLSIPVDFRDPKTKTFDIKTYERQVRNITNRSTAEFREGQARELLAAKMRDVVRDPVRVGDSEAWSEYARAHNTAVLQYAVVKESWAARWSPAFKPSEVQQWTKDNQKTFDAALKERDNQDSPKAGHLRHILVKVPEGATADEKAAALVKLSWAAARIKAGEPFAEVARDASDDGSAMQGGDVGDKTDSFVLPFKAAADALKPGEITAGAVETQFGFHLITRDDPAKVSAVEAQVKARLPQELMAHEKALGISQSVARSIADALRAGTSTTEAVKQSVAPYVVASKLDLLKVLPAPADASDAGAAPVDPSPAAASQASFDAASDPDAPFVTTSKPFARDGEPFEGLTPDATRAIVDFAFAAKDGETMQAPVRAAEGFAAVQLKNRKTATQDDFAKDADAFEEELVQTKRNEALALYVQRLRDHAKDFIKIDESYVKETAPSSGGADEDEDEF